MAFLFYDQRKRKNRFELEMNRQEAQELLMAVARWTETNPSTLHSVHDHLRWFFEDEARDKEQK